MELMQFMKDINYVSYCCDRTSVEIFVNQRHIRIIILYLGVTYMLQNSMIVETYFYEIKVIKFNFSFVEAK